MDIEQNKDVEKVIKRNARLIAARVSAVVHRQVSIMAVTKYVGTDQIQALLNQGHRLFGENKVQDAEKKIAYFSGHPDIQWHMIGHLQTNKVKKAIALFDCIQSVDSERLLKKIDEECGRVAKKMPVFLQLNLTKEASKYGFLKADIQEAVQEAFRLPHLDPQGLMVMGPNTDDGQAIDQCFSEAKAIFDKIKGMGLNQLSMGMSQDFERALNYGSTLVRLGSIFFKEENNE